MTYQRLPQFFQPEPFEMLPHWVGYIRANFKAGDYIATVNLFGVENVRQFIGSRLRQVEQCIFGRRCKNVLNTFSVYVVEPHPHSHLLISAHESLATKFDQWALGRVIDKSFRLPGSKQDAVDCRQISQDVDAVIDYVIRKQDRVEVLYGATYLNATSSLRQKTTTVQ